VHDSSTIRALLQYYLIVLSADFARKSWFFAGPKGGQLVDAVRQGLRAGVLAVVPLLIPGGQCVNDRVGWGGGELAARRRAHVDADGQRALPGGRVQQGELLQEHPGGG